MKLTKVTIDRKRWLTPDTNKNYEGGLLYDSRNGKMCCLGFASRQAGGCSVQEIKDMGLPADTERDIKGLTESEHGRIFDSDFSKDAADINDDKEINRKERERKLKKLAKENGFNFVFIN